MVETGEGRKEGEKGGGIGICVPGEMTMSDERGVK